MFIERGASRAEMYREWGTIDKEWEGVYPSPSTMNEKFRTEMALIRRSASKATLPSIWSSMQFASYSNGKASYYSGGNLNYNRILSRHASNAKKETIAKFGATGREVIEKTGLASTVGNYLEQTSENLKETDILTLAKIAYSNVEKQYVGEMMYKLVNGNLKETEKEQIALNLKKEMTHLSNELEDVVGSAHSLDGNFKEKEIFHSDDRLGPALKLNKNAYTAAQNILKQVEFYRDYAERLEVNSSALPDSKSYGKVTLPRVERVRQGGRDIYKNTTVEKDIQKIGSAMTGQMNNFFGGLFELSFASTLEKSLGSLLDDIKTLGDDSSQGIVQTKTGGPVKFSTSKIDVQANLKRYEKLSNLSVGFSAKHQVANSSVKLVETSVDNFLSLISSTAHHRNMLEIALASEDMWNSNKGAEMNGIIAALLADVAVAGLPGDRVDFMVYQDTILSLEEFFNKVAQANSLRFKPKMNISASKSAMSIRTGTGATGLMITT